jgi:periplasmic copper chaperone A
MTKIAGFLIALAAVLPPLAAMAHDHPAANIEVVHVWAPVPSEPEPKAIMVYLTLKNRSPAPDRLVRALASVASKVEIHEGGSDMKAVDAIVVAPGKDVEFSSTGPHLVLTGLKRPLQLHDSFKMALEFEQIGRVVIDVAVEDAAAPHDADAHEHVHAQ